MANQDMEVNKAKKSMGQKTGSNEQSPNVTGAGETSRSYGEDDIGNPKGDVKNRNRVRETGRPDTDMDSDTMGGDLSSDQ